MTFELQHSDISQPKLIDRDPVNDDPWPLPPVKRWEPCSAFDLDAMCEKALENVRVGVHIHSMAHLEEMRATWGYRRSLFPWTWTYETFLSQR